MTKTKCKEQVVNIWANYPYECGSPEDDKVRKTIPMKYFNGAGSFLGGKTPSRDTDWDVPISKAKEYVKALKELGIKIKISIREVSDDEDELGKELKLKDLP